MNKVHYLRAELRRMFLASIAEAQRQHDQDNKDRVDGKK